MNQTLKNYENTLTDLLWTKADQKSLAWEIKHDKKLSVTELSSQKQMKNL